MSEHIFVYGTLRKGDRANSYLNNHAEYQGQGKIKGKLYGLGGFPGLRKGELEVVGDVYLLKDRTLFSALDSYEGYNEEDEKHSLFVRKKVGLVVPEEIDEAWVYYINHQPPEHALIESGDWFNK